MGAAPEPETRGSLLVPFAALAGAIALLAVVLALLNPGGDGMAPPVTSPHPRDVPGIDATDMPRYPGSVRVGYDDGVDGRVAWSLTRYATDAMPDTVRQHYRQVFRDHGWLVGDVRYADETWSFDADRGTRDVHVEIAPDEDGTEVQVYLSWTIEQPTESPEPSATMRMGATAGATRPRLACRPASGIRSR